MQPAGKPILIITSGAYIDPELQAEFGRIPPAFLPLGGRHLYLHQYEEFREIAERIILSVPESFICSEYDKLRLVQLNIELVPVPENLSLGESIVYVINISGISGRSLLLLHGDTLLRDLAKTTPDSLSIDTKPLPEYLWGGAVLKDGIVSVTQKSDSSETNAILTGFFHFSDSSRLVQCVTRANGDFLTGLLKYGEDKSFRPLYASEWFDFGHAGSYHRSRHKVTTERVFNSLITTHRSVTKTSHERNKIAAEAQWFENLPDELRLYTPAYLGKSMVDGELSYSLEYLHLPTLSDVFVFGRARLAAWKKIFDACNEIIEKMVSYRNSELPNYSFDHFDKTIKRLESYAQQFPIDLDTPCRIGKRSLPSLRQMVLAASSIIENTAPGLQTFTHGDFCFSNLLYDSRAGKVFMIDPRAVDFDGKHTAWGDTRYDIAKLHHSVIGLYDHILAGNYKLDVQGELEFNLELPSDDYIKAIGAEFLSRSFSFKNASDHDILGMSVLLFFSMLPLHSENRERQMALLANGMRMFLILDDFIG